MEIIVRNTTRVLVTFVFVVMLLGPTLRAQSTTNSNKPAVRACALLPKDLITKTTPYDKQALDLVLKIPPDEDPPGTCHYGGITLQVDPFTPTRLESLRKQLGKAWVPISDLASTAYFNDNDGRYAELFVSTGSRVFTIQMDVPRGRTTESVKPNVVALAKAIKSKLQ